MSVTASIRRAVDKALSAGETRYSIAKGASIEYATLARWLDQGKDIRASTIDALAAYLGLELTPVNKRKK